MKQSMLQATMKVKKKKIKKNGNRSVVRFLSGLKVF
jgi:hypothetical protein